MKRIYWIVLGVVAAVGAVWVVAGSAVIYTVFSAASSSGGWRPESNGERHELRFELHDPLGYSDHPVRVRVQRVEFRPGGFAGHSSGPQRRVNSLHVNGAHCTPSSLCSVTILKADAGENQPAELEIRFAAAGDGALVVNARDGLSWISDSWQIAADPPPDDVVLKTEPDVLTVGDEFTAEVAAMRGGKALRGPVSAQVIYENTRRPSAQVAVIQADRNRGQLGCPDDTVDCSENPAANFALPRTLSLHVSAAGRATLVLTAGAVEHRYSFSALRHVEDAAIEIFACAGTDPWDKTGSLRTGCRRFASDTAYCRAGETLFARGMARDMTSRRGAQSYDREAPDLAQYPVESEDEKVAEVGKLARLRRTSPAGVLIEDFGHAARIECAMPGVTRLRLPQETTDATVARTVEVLQAGAPLPAAAAFELPRAETGPPAHVLTAAELKMLYGAQRSLIESARGASKLRYVVEPDGKIYGENLILGNMPARWMTGRWRVDAANQKMCHDWDRKMPGWTSACFSVLETTPHAYEWSPNGKPGPENDSYKFTIKPWSGDRYTVEPVNQAVR